MDKKVLLIADDDEMNRIVIKRFLSEYFEIIEADNGRKTLDIIDSHHIDVLLLDIIMPEIDGLKVLELLRGSEKYDNLGILVATSTKEKTERAALSLGADDIVSKPYDPIVIKKRIENILLLKEKLVKERLIDKRDITGIVNQKNDEIKQQISKSVEHILRITKVMKMSLSNEKLMDEMVDNINKEMETIQKIYTDTKE